MTTEQQVLATKNPQEAILALARALDRLEQQLLHQAESTEDWLSQDWSSRFEDPDIGGGPAFEGIERRTAVTADDHEGGNAMVETPPPTEERKELRRLFEQQHLHLSEHLGDDEDWTEAFATGGPMWLYLGNRELVISYPDQVRMALVTDVEMDSPQDAQEMARDILKHPGETGPGSVAMDVGSVPVSGP